MVVEDDDENPYEKKKRKKTSKAWEEFKEVSLWMEVIRHNAFITSIDL